MCEDDNKFHLKVTVADLETALFIRQCFNLAQPSCCPLSVLLSFIFWHCCVIKCLRLLQFLWPPHILFSLDIKKKTNMYWRHQKTLGTPGNPKLESAFDLIVIKNWPQNSKPGKIGRFTSVKKEGKCLPHLPKKEFDWSKLMIMWLVIGVRQRF